MNLGTALVLAVLVAIVSAIVLPMVRRRRRGEFFCSGGCSGCSHACSCAGNASGKSDSSLTRLTLEVDGMSCSMCETHINDVVRRNFLIVNVKSSFRQGQTVVLTALPIDEQKLRNVICDTGYKVLSIRTDKVS